MIIGQGIRSRRYPSSVNASQDGNFRVQFLSSDFLALEEWPVNIFYFTASIILASMPSTSLPRLERFL